MVTSFRRLAALPQRLWAANLAWWLPGGLCCVHDHTKKSVSCSLICISRQECPESNSPAVIREGCLHGSAHVGDLLEGSELWQAQTQCLFSCGWQLNPTPVLFSSLPVGTVLQLQINGSKMFNSSQAGATDQVYTSSDKHNSLSRLMEDRAAIDDCLAVACC